MIVYNSMLLHYQSDKIAQNRLLFKLGFFAFAGWFLIYPRLALSYSVSVYQQLPLPCLLFILSLVAFALLARANKLNKLPFSNIFATLSCLVAVLSGLVFVFLDTATGRLLSFSVIAVLAAHLLVVWGSVLRSLTLWESFSLLAKVLLAVGGFKIVCGIAYLVSGGSSPYPHYLFVLLLASALPLGSALYFLSGLLPGRLRRQQQADGQGQAVGESQGDGQGQGQGERQGQAVVEGQGDGQGVSVGDCGGQRERERWHSDWPEAGGRALAGASLALTVLYAAAALTLGVEGYSFRPAMLSPVELDSLQGLFELIIALLALIAVRVGQRPPKPERGLTAVPQPAALPGEPEREGTASAEPEHAELRRRLAALPLPGDPGFSAFVPAIFLGLLILTGLAFLLAFFGQAVVVYAQAMIRAVGDSFFLAMLFFCRLFGGSRRRGYFKRLLLVILCSGVYWSFALGSAIQRLVGYDASTVTFVSAGSVVVLSILVATVMALRANAQALGLARPVGLASGIEAGGQVAGHTGAGRQAVGHPGAGSQAVGLEARGQAVDDDELQTLVKTSILQWRRQALAPYKLSKREFELACMLLEGFTAPAIAERLGISLNTVKGYMKSLYKKCDVISKAELINLVVGDAKNV